MMSPRAFPTTWTVRPMNAVRCLLLLILLLLHPASRADSEELTPYLLSSHVKGDMVQRVIQVKEALLAGGFEWVGEYVPDPDRHVIIVTHDLLKQAARQEVGAYFLLPLRVAVTRVAGRLQVSYVNPLYYAHAYRMQTDVSEVQVLLQGILGVQERFGATGLTPQHLSTYRYSYGMEQFHDLLQLARFDRHDLALAAVERGLERLSGRMLRAFRLDLPGQSASLFGVALRDGPGSDQAVTAAVDVAPLRHTARLPYMLLVRQGRVMALHPRFKLPLDFPDLARTGKHSLTAILSAPEAIEQALRALFRQAPG